MNTYALDQVKNVCLCSGLIDDPDIENYTKERCDKMLNNNLIAQVRYRLNSLFNSQDRSGDKRPNDAWLLSVMNRYFPGHACVNFSIDFNHNYDRLSMYYENTIKWTTLLSKPDWNGAGFTQFLNKFIELLHGKLSCCASSILIVKLDLQTHFSDSENCFDHSVHICAQNTVDGMILVIYEPHGSICISDEQLNVYKVMEDMFGRYCDKYYSTRAYLFFPLYNTPTIQDQLNEYDTGLCKVADTFHTFWTMTILTKYKTNVCEWVDTVDPYLKRFKAPNLTLLLSLFSIATLGLIDTPPTAVYNEGKNKYRIDNNTSLFDITEE